MAVFSATVKISTVTDAVTDRYGKVEKEKQFHELLDIEIKAPTLEKLQEKITAHVNLVESL
jgi:hypothetical protein